MITNNFIGLPGRIVLDYVELLQVAGVSYNEIQQAVVVVRIFLVIQVAKHLNEKYHHIVGDVLLSSGIVAYPGAF